MKNRLFLVFGAIVLFAFGAFVYKAWPYFGLLPNILPPPIDLGTIETPTSNSGGVAAGTNGTGLPLKLPDGFSIGIFAKSLTNARVLVTDPDGNAVLSMPSQGKVVVLPDQNKDGKADEIVTLISGLNKPHGLAFDCNGAEDVCHLYVAETGSVSVYDYNPQSFEAVNPKKLFNLPADGIHFSRTLQMLPDGRLLVAIGSDCNVCSEKDPLRASVQVWDGKELKPFAIGLRNSVFITQKADGAIWATEMGRDLLGDDIPPDEINILQEGKNYGWPNCYGKNIHDDSFDKNVYIRNPCMEPFEMASKIDLQAHSAPLGLVFIPANSSWPKEYWGNLLVAYHGSWNRSVPTGYKIQRFVLDGSGNVMSTSDFLTGFTTTKGDVLGRPVGLLFEADGTLLVSDDRAGLVYRITPPKK